jgi:hypothetical protein
MPMTAAFIDSLREAFGVPMINASIKGGMAGDGSFYASENGLEIGSRPRDIPGAAINANDLASSFVRKAKK